MSKGGGGGDSGGGGGDGDNSSISVYPSFYDILNPLPTKISNNTKIFGLFQELLFQKLLKLNRAIILKRKNY